jgi:hypothetical protein
LPGGRGEGPDINGASPLALGPEVWISFNFRRGMERKAYLRA